MALAKIANHAELPATLITLGDYVDRGPDSPKIIERLMRGLGHEGWRLICLKGNHEDIMWQTCRRRVPDCGWWLTNGGGATLALAERIRRSRTGRLQSRQPAAANNHDPARLVMGETSATFDTDLVVPSTGPAQWLAESGRS
jgi:Calcineurin-like phosphoesterase